MKYFAYGSNMDKNQMKDRCPNAIDLGLATLPGYELFYTGFSDRWNGAVASIRPNESNTLYGRLWEFNDEDLKTMDKFEGYPTNYDRHSMQITHNETPANAQIYIKEGENAIPSFKYTDVIRSGYNQLNILDKFKF